MAEVRCQLAKIVMSESHDRQIVMLEEVDGSRRFSIIIGFFEVFAIHRSVNDEPPPRPLTHELIGNMFHKLDIQLDRIVINDLKDGTYYARLIVQDGDSSVAIDSRPSDAIAVATHVGAPIFVADHVIEQATQDII